MPTIETQPPAKLKDERVTTAPLLVTPTGNTIGTKDAWDSQRDLIKADWLRYLGEPPFDPPPLRVTVTQEHDFTTHSGQLLRMRMEPEYDEQCYLMVPKRTSSGKLPAVVVFFYDVDTPAGHNMGSPRWKPNSEIRQFARHLVERGYVAMVQRWAFEGYLEAEDADTKTPGLSGRYAPAVARHQRIAPNWKGLGRVVWDASRVVDYLLTLDFVDPDRIACMGHSLGGKMALYAAAFDDRIAAGIGSDLGIGLSFSNWDAPWYLGPEVREPSFGRDHHQLLGLLAPRPFLLIAGEDADGDRSWAYLNTAKDVYNLYGAADKLAMYNHGTGHSPTWDSLHAAYAWLDEQLQHHPPGQA